ncbi:HNH endonuclease [uncultured Methanobrevibacter sp.]|uniref:HNH endonuclease n=1 Tax=uncultured Methanobrevibacter sp. TaxID=253161 RepID=UPI002600530D|nr:HNH endonuclease signature motif containing protein [uncultured Methanobrevibacter sp.]
MEKYCHFCDESFKNSAYKKCPYCGNNLISRFKRKPISGKLRHQVFQRDNYRCRECGATNKETTLHIDHIKPVSKGGTNHIDNLQTLCKKCNLAKSTDEWVGGSLDSQNLEVKKIKVLSVKDKKQIRFKRWSETTSDEELDLLYNHFPNVVHSRVKIIKYLVNNFSDHYIEKLLIGLKERKNKYFVELCNSLTDKQLKLLYEKFNHVNHSKEDMIDYLSNNYSINQIKPLLYNLQKEKGIPSERFDSAKLKKVLNPERMKLLNLLDTNEDYIISRLLGFSGNQIQVILNELDNINNQLNELNKQKDKKGFCILGFRDVWYYYYLTSNKKYSRFYADSKSKLKNIVLKNNLCWYNEKFECNILSEDKNIQNFISSEICSKIHFEADTPHEVYYPLNSINVTSKKIYEEVISHLGCVSEYNYFDELFKPVIYQNSLPKHIICPNCGRTIPKNAVRCKFCKIMMKDLINNIEELELYGLNPNEFILIKY